MALSVSRENPVPRDRKLQWNPAHPEVLTLIDDNLLFQLDVLYCLCIEIQICDNITENYNNVFVIYFRSHTVQMHSETLFEFDILWHQPLCFDTVEYRKMPRHSIPNFNSEGVLTVIYIFYIV